MINPFIAGVDEAGRGPLAGPVVAAAVILPKQCEINGLKDSKKLTEKKREALLQQIETKAVAFSVGIVHEDVIESINILGATHKAMRLALGRLSPQPVEALIDGHALPDQVVRNRGVIKGDQKVPAISAASIVAKVTRDRIMRSYDRIFPEYAFAKHKGYGTPEHLTNLKTYLACPIHRKSFRPVSDYLPSLAQLKEERKLGKWGERLAARELMRKGYSILGMNFSALPYGDFDIVAMDGETVVFAEVKSSLQEWLGDSEDQINDNKIEKLLKSMKIYLSEKEIESESRFDLLTVRFGGGPPTVAHYINCLS
mgnify:CR=1 FL=1